MTCSDDTGTQKPATPITVSLKMGNHYLWCACGNSKKQPFCDGRHRGTDITPVKYVPRRTHSAPLCRCKSTGFPPFCDGSHLKISQ